MPASPPRSAQHQARLTQQKETEEKNISLEHYWATFRWIDIREFVCKYVKGMSVWNWKKAEGSAASKVPGVRRWNAGFTQRGQSPRPAGEHQTPALTACIHPAMETLGTNANSSVVTHLHAVTGSPKPPPQRAAPRGWAAASRPLGTGRLVVSVSRGMLCSQHHRQPGHRTRQQLGQKRHPGDWGLPHNNWRGSLKQLTAQEQHQPVSFLTRSQKIWAFSSRGTSRAQPSEPGQELERAAPPKNTVTTSLLEDERGFPQALLMPAGLSTQQAGRCAQPHHRPQHPTNLLHKELGVSRTRAKQALSGNNNCIFVILSAAP